MSIYQGNTLIPRVYHGQDFVRSVWSGGSRVFPGAGLETGTGYNYGTITGPNANGAVRYQEDLSCGSPIRYYDAGAMPSGLLSPATYSGMRGFRVDTAGNYFVRYFCSVASAGSSKTDSASIFNNSGEYVASRRSVTCPAGYTNSIELVVENAYLSAGDIVWWGWDKSDYWGGTFSTHFMLEKL